jgi:hypothetical protein
VDDLYLPGRTEASFKKINEVVAEFGNRFYGNIFLGKYDRLMMNHLGLAFDLHGGILVIETRRLFEMRLNIPAVTSWGKSFTYTAARKIDFCLKNVDWALVEAIKEGRHIVPRGEGLRLFLSKEG